MLLGSFLPMIVDAAIKSWMLPLGYLEALRGTIKGGEVFILTTAMITPFFVLLIKKVAGKIKIQFKLFPLIFIFSLASLIGGVLTFSYFRIGQMISDNSVNVIPTTKVYLESIFSADLTILGILIYIVSLVVWYYSAYHENNEGSSYQSTVSKGQKNLHEKVF